LTHQPGGIGFADFVANPPSSVKIMSISPEKGAKAILPSPNSIADGSYPLSRFLNIYVVRTPGEPLDETLRDFLSFVLSRQGQQIVLKEGMMPLSAAIVAEELAKLR
jgi:phosphate transport system substrate-binding protein